MIISQVGNENSKLPILMGTIEKYYVIYLLIFNAKQKQISYFITLINVLMYWFNNQLNFLICLYLAPGN